MKEEDRDDEGQETLDGIDFYDPFAHHFISQNNKNDFLKALEEGQAELAYRAVR